MLCRLVRISQITAASTWLNRTIFTGSRPLQEQKTRKPSRLTKTDRSRDQKKANSEFNDEGIDEPFENGKPGQKAKEAPTPVLGTSEKKTVKLKTESLAPSVQTSRASKVPPPLKANDSKHHDLGSFLRYAASVHLNLTTSVHKGTLYEYVVQNTLKSFNFSLSRTGQANDLGIDLLGLWQLPDHTAKMPREIRIIIQCKASQASPAMIRELEGAFAAAPARRIDLGVMALLVANKEATAGVFDAVQRSRRAMGIMQVTDDGELHQFLWNAAAETAGLQGLGVTKRFTNDGQGRSIALTWMGHIWRM